MVEIKKSLRIEDNFEELSVKALSDVSLSGVKARYAEEITDEDIQVIFETEGNLDEVVLQVGDYRKYSAYEGSLAFVITTNRAKIKNHSDKIAKVRHIMMPENGHLQNEYYQILETKEISATTDVDTELNSDTTAISFNVKFLLVA